MKRHEAKHRTAEPPIDWVLHSMSVQTALDFCEDQTGIFLAKGAAYKDRRLKSSSNLSTLTVTFQSFFIDSFLESDVSDIKSRN